MSKMTAAKGIILGFRAEGEEGFLGLMKVGRLGEADQIAKFSKLLN